MLFAWSGSRGTSFGPHIWTGELGLLNYHTWKLKVDKSAIDPTFFFHALKKLTEFIEGRAHGASALVHTQKWEMEGFQFPLPSTETEQEAIATALSDADALIEGLEQLTAKKRLIMQGAMQDLLSARRRLHGFSGEWEVKPLGDLLTIRHGKSQRGVEDGSGNYPILATGGQIGIAKRYLYDKPSVLIGRKGTIDRPLYMETPFWSVDTLFYSIIRGLNNPKVIYYLFKSIDWRSYNEASGVPSLSAKTIEAIEKAVPKPDEQRAISTVLSNMDEELAALEERLAKTRTIKQGMMQELLTGRVRLI